MTGDLVGAEDVDEVIAWCECCDSVARGPMVAVAMWSMSHLKPQMLAVRVNVPQREPFWVRMGVAA